MDGLGYDTESDREKDILKCVKKVADEDLDQAMQDLSEIYDKQDMLAIQGIFS